MNAVEMTVSPAASGHRKPAVRSLEVLSSGWAEQHREHRYGSSMPTLWWVLTSRSWVQLPIHCFLIAHRDGPVLFDAGLDPAIATDRGYIASPVGRFLLRRLFRFHVTAADRLDRVLARHGIDPRAIRTAVISHLHFDHIGGIAHLPRAELVVSEREWAQLSEPHPERDWILREHIDIPRARWRPVAFEKCDDPLFEGFAGVHDLMGDGSLMLLPTPGHTPGSLSMLIRSTGWAPILLVGDLTYDTLSLERGLPPGVGDPATLRASFEKVRRLRQRLPDLVIVPSHDFSAAERIGQAMRDRQRVAAAF